MGNTGFGNGFNQSPIMPIQESLKTEMTFKEIFDVLQTKIRASGLTAK
jgi:hypothetical protein